VLEPIALGHRLPPDHNNTQPSRYTDTALAQMTTMSYMEAVGAHWNWMTMKMTIRMTNYWMMNSIQYDNPMSWS
jgi:hypothetical protein